MNDSSNLVDVWTGMSAVEKSAPSDCSVVIMLKSEAELAYYIRIDRLFCVITGILFSVGIVANVWVIHRIVRALTSTSGPVCSSPRHVFVYLGALAVTDLFVLLNCPFLIHDVAHMQWNFGSFLCKWLYGNESLNKLLSGFILAALSFDQLITVRKILPSSWRTVSAAWKMMGVLTFVATILLIPLFIYTRVITLIDDQYDEDDNVTTHAIQKCVFAPPPDMFHLANGFMLSLFVLGFCIPTLCIGVSYGTIMHRFMASGYVKRPAIRENADTGRPLEANGRGRRRPLRTRRLITWYILLLVVIYLACWTPYWTAAVKVSLAPHYFNDPQKYNHLAVTYALLYIHLLPYLNAVLNAFAYGAMITFSTSINAGQRQEEDRDAHPAQISLRTYRVATRFSLGETWSYESALVDKRKSTVESRKWPSAVELRSEVTA